VQVPREPLPGVPIDLVEAVAWDHSADDGVPDYADAAVLRAGDSAQTVVVVPADGGRQADLSGYVDPGPAGGDAGGD
jgi:hypothetical protein